MVVACLLLPVLLTVTSCQKKDKPSEEALPAMEEPSEEAPAATAAPPEAAPPGSDGDGGGSYSFDEKEKTPEDKTSQ
jgi:hypothetical protein